jgi:hypothetical protein
MKKIIKFIKDFFKKRKQKKELKDKLKSMKQNDPFIYK